MTQRCTPLRMCPDCGGILQPVEPERLTSAEVASNDGSGDHEGGACQCLICGYQEPASPVGAPVR